MDISFTFYALSLGEKGRELVGGVPGCRIGLVAGGRARFYFAGTCYHCYFNCSTGDDFIFARSQSKKVVGKCPRADTPMASDGAMYVRKGRPAHSGQFRPTLPCLDNGQQLLLMYSKSASRVTTTKSSKHVRAYPQHKKKSTPPPPAPHPTQTSSAHLDELVVHQGPRVPRVVAGRIELDRSPEPAERVDQGFGDEVEVGRADVLAAFPVFIALVLGEGRGGRGRGRGRTTKLRRALQRSGATGGVNKKTDAHTSTSVGFPLRLL